MAIKVFLLLNSCGVAFLLYVLAHFFKEGRAQKNALHNREAELRPQDRPGVVVAVHPTFRSGRGGRCVIPFQARNRKPAEVRAGKTSPSISKTIEMPVRRLSSH